MTESDDIRATVDEWYELPEGAIYERYPALLSAVEKVLARHPCDTPMWDAPFCKGCGFDYPCLTVQAIQEALGGVNHD